MYFKLICVVLQFLLCASIEYNKPSLIVSAFVYINIYMLGDVAYIQQDRWTD